MGWLLPMRLALPQMPPLVLRVSLAGSVLAGLVLAQEPSAALKQADADYRAGTTALYSNDLKTAQAKFEEIGRAHV